MLATFGEWDRMVSPLVAIAVAPCALRGRGSADWQLLLVEWRLVVSVPDEGVPPSAGEAVAASVETCDLGSARTTLPAAPAVICATKPHFLN